MSRRRSLMTAAMIVCVCALLVLAVNCFLSRERAIPHILDDVYIIVDDSDAEYRDVYCLNRDSVIFRRMVFPSRKWKSPILAATLSEDTRAEFLRVLRAARERISPPLEPHGTWFSIIHLAAADGGRADAHYRDDSESFVRLRDKLAALFGEARPIDTVPAEFPCVDQVRLFLDVE